MARTLPLSAGSGAFFASGTSADLSDAGFSELAASPSGFGAFDSFDSAAGGSFASTALSFTAAGFSFLTAGLSSFFAPAAPAFSSGARRTGERALSPSVWRPTKRPAPVPTSSRPRLSSATA